MPARRSDTTSATARPAPDPRTIGARLDPWFAHAARDLPWRRRRDGYRALVAEMMLQQTQVARVVERYAEFLRRFPSVRALADADEQDVLAVWQGLGYYRRARHLHRAARVVMDRHRGRMPRTASALRDLPGVGRYTAGAIASIVHGERAAIVDGNVQRVLARLWADDAPPDASAARARAWDRAEAIVQAAVRPGIVNEAMMELGATVCTPAAPRCTACPLRSLCLAARQGRAGEIPPPRARATCRDLHLHAVVVSRGRRMLVERRPDTGLWSGMWQPPTIESARPLRPERLRCRLEVPVTDWERCGGFRHRTTHRDITFHVYRARSRARRGTWRTAEELARLPLSNAHRRALALSSE